MTDSPTPEFGGKNWEYETVDVVEATYFQILRKNKPLKVKFLWLILSLTMMVFACYVVYLLLVDYFDYPSYNKITSEHTSSMVLPAISICNLNGLNKTLMEAITLPGGNKTLYDAYVDLEEKYEGGGTDALDTTTSTSMYTQINNEEVHTYFRFNVSLAPVNSKFAMRDIDLIGAGKVRQTAYGDCIEVNDDEVLEQKSSGPVGGLELVLDAQIGHYIDAIESEGFQIFLRMPNETVLNSGYGFAASPGQHVKVNLKSTTVTRLGSPQGSCINTTSLYEIETNYKTEKECKLTNHIWYFLKNPGCNCWPWYVEDRFMEEGIQISQILRQGSTVEDRLINYFTVDIDSSYRLTIPTNETCYNTYRYNGSSIDTISSIGNASLCAVECRANSNCAAFGYNKAYTATTDYGSVGDCMLYNSTATITTELIQNVTWGKVNCTNIEKCGKSEEQMCENLFLASMMADDGPELCGEPCNYMHYDYTLSSSSFPGKNYWQNTLSETSGYSSWADAKNNLVKISIYYETLEAHMNDQTASYEIQNFIAEFGGLVDLLVGLSFFTMFQLMELFVVWLINLCRGKKAKPVDDDVVEMNMSARA